MSAINSKCTTCPLFNKCTLASASIQLRRIYCERLTVTEPDVKELATPYVGLRVKLLLNNIHLN